MTITPLAEQQLDEITARADAARSGPWILSDDLEGDGYPGHLWVVRTPDSGPDEPDNQAVVVSIGDRALGEFIAHAREDVPALLAEINRLRTDLERRTEDVAFLERVTLPGLRREIEHHKDGKQRWRGRAEKAETTLERVCRVASRLAAHAVGFQDVLDDSDRDPWAKTVGADIAELSAALSPDTVPTPTSAPPTASHSPAGDRDGETGTEGAAGREGDPRAPGIPQPVEDLAAVDNPTPLRWGLDDVLWGDDDSVIVLMSGPDREPYWLELDPERAAVLRRNLAGPEGEEGARIAITRSDLAVLLAHHADVLAAQLRTDVGRDAWIAAERLTEHANELTTEEEPPAVTELLDNIWTFRLEQQDADPEDPAPRRTLTPNEYSAAWHAVEGAASEEGADPATVLHAVLNRLGIDTPATTEAGR